MPRASIIVPVYNVKEYLKKCVDSVLAQTQRDFELLLIDDGSTDGCGELCDTFAEADSRIRVIHQENGGLGSARNTGIQAAAGEWLLFVDSDDWIEPEILEKALAAGERENAELVLFAFRSVDPQGRELGVFRDDLPPEKPFTAAGQKDVFLASPCAWNKLYRRELFLRTGVLYPPRVWYEDIRTTLKLFAAAKSMLRIDDVGYNYLQRPGSITNNINVERNVEILDAFEDILAWFRQEGLFETYQDELCCLTVSHVLIAASVRVIRIDRKHRLIGRFSAYVKEQFPNYRSAKSLSRLTKNQKIILSLLEKKLYWAVALIFKVKG